MKPSDEIDKYILSHPDWRGHRLAEVRDIILSVNSDIIEEWKWMGSPVWEKEGIICVGNIFKEKVQIVFMNGAFLSDPDKLFNAGLEGNQRRSIDFFKGDMVEVNSLKNLILAAINYNHLKKKK